MKKKILSQLMILSFAFAGLFLVGNNVLGNSRGIGDLDDQPAISCHQNAEPGRFNECWRQDGLYNCEWTGAMDDVCFLLYK